MVEALPLPIRRLSANIESIIYVTNISSSSATDFSFRPFAMLDALVTMFYFSMFVLLNTYFMPHNPVYFACPCRNNYAIPNLVISTQNIHTLQ